MGLPLVVMLPEEDCSARLLQVGSGAAPRVLEPPYFSTIATTPRPPAAQIEIRPRPPLFSSMILARVARMRPPVAAKGWPAARLPPLMLSLALSIEPSGWSR